MRDITHIDFDDCDQPRAAESYSDKAVMGGSNWDDIVKMSDRITPDLRDGWMTRKEYIQYYKDKSGKTLSYDQARMRLIRLTKSGILECKKGVVNSAATMFYRPL